MDYKDYELDITDQTAAAKLIIIYDKDFDYKGDIYLYDEIVQDPWTLDKYVPESRRLNPKSDLEAEEVGYGIAEGHLYNLIDETDFRYRIIKASEKLADQCPHIKTVSVYRCGVYIK